MNILSMVVLSASLWARAAQEPATKQAPSSGPSNEFVNRCEVTGITSDARLFAFLRRIQRAVKSSDKQKISRMLNYPIQVNVEKHQKWINGPKEFLANYDLIFNETVKTAVLSQKEASLFCNQKGVMIGHGELWFGGVDQEQTIKITAINN